MFVRSSGERAAFAFAVAVETDPARTGPEGKDPGPGGRPPILTPGDAQQMLAHLAADLKSMLHDIRKCRLATAGAVFDQCQLLRPGAPVFSALARLADSAATDGGSPGLIAVGSGDNGMPDAVLEPDRRIPRGLLQLIPLIVEGPRKLLEDLAQEMEHRFLAEGQLSAHTASWLEAVFGYGVAHARFMTMTDLNAMLRLQLEHFGYLPLWELVDAALTERQAALELTTDRGGHYRWLAGSVWITFESFDHWSNHGLGQATEAQGDTLPRGYAEWNRELRCYTSTLSAHAIPLQFELPEGCQGEVVDNFLFEKAPLSDDPENLAAITEHSWPDLGIVAITAQTAGSLRHYYPLAPQGLNDIHEALRELDLTGDGVAFPGRIEYSRTNRRLRAAAFE